jgi:hypothetical protein
MKTLYLYKKLSILLATCSFLASQQLIAQAVQESPKIPPILVQRADENYSTISKNSLEGLLFGDLKQLRLRSDTYPFISIGAELRSRLEHTSNINFSTTNSTAYLKRLSAHFAINISRRFGLFTEFYSGYSSAGEQFLQSDDLAFHQAFLEWVVLKSENASTRIRLGRQELAFGTSRLVGLRNGPNMRRSFDMARIQWQSNRKSIDLLFGEEVAIQPGLFDNNSSILGSGKANNRLWGVYLQFPSSDGTKFFDLYYLGFLSNNSVYNDVSGKETRHSYGMRSHGSWGRFTFNTELTLQSGTLNTNDIFAFNFETDWKYRLFESGWKPKIGLKLDWSSGDNAAADGKLETYNPLFVNPGIYSLAAVNTPVNLTSVHPSITFFPFKGFVVYMDYAFFYRTQKSDGFYRPPNILIRPANSGSSKHLGDTFGMRLSYTFNRNLTFEMLSSYFIPGRFIEESGSSENIFYIAPTLSFKF